MSKELPIKMTKVSEDFFNKVRDLSYERTKRGIDERPSIAKVTKEMAKSPKWDDLEKDVLEKRSDSRFLPDLSFKRNKRGQFAGIFLWIAVGFAFVITIVAIMLYVNTLSSTLTNAAEGLNTATVNATQAAADTVGKLPEGYASIKWITYSIIIAMALSTVAAAAIARKHPAILVPYVLVIVVAIIFSVPVSNTYEMIYQDPVLADTFAGFTGTNWIFLNLPIIVTIIGIFGAILCAINIQRDPGGYT